MKKDLLAVVLVIIIIVAAASVAFVVRLRANQSNADRTTAVAGYYFQIQELNQSNTMIAGTTVLFVFNISSPMNGTIYYGIVIPPEVPPFHQNLTMQNMTSQDFQLPTGVQINYPDGNAIIGTTQGTASIQVTLSPTLQAGQIYLEFEVMQQYTLENVDGQGRGFTLTVLAA